MEGKKGGMEEGRRKEGLLWNNTLVRRLNNKGVPVTYAKHIYNLFISDDIYIELEEYTHRLIYKGALNISKIRVLYLHLITISQDDTRQV